METTIRSFPSVETTRKKSNKRAPLPSLIKLHMRAVLPTLACDRDVDYCYPSFEDAHTTVSGYARVY
jgi:hypothetical protein